jgi:hypothetical protein
MKSTLGLIAGLIALVGLILSADAPLTGGVAVAGSARCAAHCTNWCATNRVRRNLESCSDWCQQKQCH